MFNHDLDGMFRQGIVQSKETAIKFIVDYLKLYGINNPMETATKFVDWRNSINIVEFNKINVNSYIDKTPAHIDKKHKMINEWIEAHTTYYSPIYGGGVKSVPTYPMKFN